jgi:RNA polymerase sigma-70 factor (ECF subfamily)
MGLGWLASHPSDDGLSPGTPARPSRRDQELPATGAARSQQIPDGRELVPDRFQAGLTVLPTEEDLVVETPALHPTDQNLSVGIPALAPAVRPARGEAASLEIDWSQIVRRCMDGDSSAWAELVRAQHRRVYGLCYRFTGNPADAEDLTQDVFLKIYSNLASFDLNRGSLQVWIATMTRNLLVDNFRRTRNQRATSSLDDGWESADELKPIDRLTARGVSPLEAAASNELAKMVQDALARVSVDLREAVILRDLQDMDYKEIACVLGIPEGTVKSRISRGRAELARLLERTKREVM